MLTSFLKKIYNFIKKNFSYFIIFGYATLVFLLMVRINFFRYDDFGQGKFDLGNMTQMAWYSLRGKFMYLTDYFGSNVPRWSMSHVDPILVLFLPIFYLIPHPLTLVFSQNLLIILGAFLIYEIAKLKTKNEVFSVLIALAYLSFPALGFLLSLTGYHGVSPAIFFFLFFVYYYEKILSRGTGFRVKDYLILIILMIITMSGKEQIPLYFFVFGFYIFISSSYKKFASFTILFSLTWFVVCFLVVIPTYASYRINSFEHFVTEMGINKNDVPNVYSSNYFLQRYSEFGDSYFEIVKNMALDPIKTASVFLNGDKLNNIIYTFGPVGFLSFLHPLIILVAFPDLLINYSTTQGGIGTSEIYNHRISMIIPVIFISICYGVGFIQKFLKFFFYEKYIKVGISFLGIFLFINNIYFSLYVGEPNPLFAWLKQSINKRVEAKSDKQIIKQNLIVGELVEVSPYIENDRGCVKKILNIIPPLVSVSGPDFMGSHLAQRETYAIFPAGKTTSDYLIVDLYSKKLLTILGLSYSLNRNYIESVFKSKDYSLIYSCSNLMVFRKSEVPVSDNEKLHLIPIQKYNSYVSKNEYDLYKGFFIVDSKFENSGKVGELFNITNVYTKKDSSGLDGYNIFTTLIHKESGEMYQFVNYPSAIFTTPDEFKKDMFYEEKLDFRIPDYLEKGKYMIFTGIENKIKSRSLYIGDITLE